MGDIDRRDFLKMLGLGTTALMGCSPEPAQKLIPYILPAEDLTPGEATWYATTCRECPAGCGMLAKNRDGRIIKVEGNPLHPVNRGRLCPRGQASLQGLYSPDRFRGPLRRNPQGYFDPISWNRGMSVVLEKLSEVRRKKGKIAFVSQLVNGALKNLLTKTLRAIGSSELILYEPYAYESLRSANQIVFGLDGIPVYPLDQADFIISFGAGFLETWVSNVEYAQKFAAFHSVRESGKNRFVYVGPRFSMTAASADLWIPVSPGDEYLIGLAILRAILDGDLSKEMSPDRKAALKPLVEPFPLEKVSHRTGVDRRILEWVAGEFSRAHRPLALAEGLSLSGPKALQAAIAANLLCTVSPGTAEILDLGKISFLGSASRLSAMKRLTEKIDQGEIDLLFIYGANPVFSLPGSWNFERVLEKTFVVSFSSEGDETSSLAQLVLPTHTPLESWGDYMPQSGIRGLMQPAMGPVTNTQPLGDLLLALGKAFDPGGFPWQDFHSLLMDAWQEKESGGPGAPLNPFWIESLKRGGFWESREKTVLKLGALKIPAFPEPAEEAEGYFFSPYPTIQFYDGRTANRPWTQELPDPMTQVTWGGWVEIHPDTANALGIKKGDLLRLESSCGSLEAPAYPIALVPKRTLAVPIGQGHRFGRFAKDLPANPWVLVSPEIEDATGGFTGPSFRVTLKKIEGRFAVAHTDGSWYQHQREIAQALSWSEYEQLKRAGRGPEIRMPLSSGVRPETDFYPPHVHSDYRWVMIVDLDRCIGCGACVAACYAENNVPVVGREQVLRGREMSWLHIERYFEKGNPGIRFLPMLCQHCDFAPCESVCPVFAPHHNPDGINNQVYNRCIGTRDCSQNCPYKVRRFNWFTFEHEAPLQWQLNPDVTVRQKGVMEKCSFCIQRIVGARVRARTEGRKIRDGEVTTACAQTCPAGVFTFGNLKDPESRVSKLIRDPRAYQVLQHLNTKPGVIYLKKITQELKI